MQLSINLDGTGKCSSATGIPFLDHMMDVSCKRPSLLGRPRFEACLLDCKPLLSLFYRTR